MNCSFVRVINDIVDGMEEAAFDEPNLCENHPKAPVDMVLTARVCVYVWTDGAGEGPAAAAAACECSLHADGRAVERASLKQEYRTNSGNYTRLRPR